MLDYDRSMEQEHRNLPLNWPSRAVSRIRARLSMPHWTEHDLRRTAASHMASIGTQRLVIAQILNHTDSSVTAVYDRHGYDAEKQVALARWANEVSIASKSTPPSPPSQAAAQASESNAACSSTVSVALACLSGG